MNWKCLILLTSACVGLTGCFGFLKPARSTARQFVLTSPPAPDTNSVNPAVGQSLAVGIGPVNLPEHLLKTSIGIRTNGNEIVYLDSAFWAERLDKGLQRALASNLATLLPSDQIRLSAWERGDVSVEVYVTIQRFDVDATGQGVLEASWRIQSPKGNKTVKSGRSHFSRQSSRRRVSPDDTVATLSALATDLSRELAQAIKQAESQSTLPH